MSTSSTARTVFATRAIRRGFLALLVLGLLALVWNDLLTRYWLSTGYARLHDERLNGALAAFAMAEAYAAKSISYSQDAVEQAATTALLAHASSDMDAAVVQIISCTELPVPRSVCVYAERRALPGASIGLIGRLRRLADRSALDDAHRVEASQLLRCLRRCAGTGFAEAIRPLLATASEMRNLEMKSIVEGALRSSQQADPVAPRPVK